MHGPFVSDQEVERVVSFLKSQGKPAYLDAITEDDGARRSASAGDWDGEQLRRQALRAGGGGGLPRAEGSTSFIQRHLQIGYNRAARIIERMEPEGVVCAANHVGKREVLARSIEDRD